MAARRAPTCTLTATILTVAATAVIATGSACDRRTRRTGDDTLVILLDGKVRTVDPRFIITNNDVKVSRLVVPGLTTIDQPSLEPMPLLARSLEQTGPLTWDITLRPGLRFSDGSPLGATDVAYTFDSLRDRAVDSPLRATFDERIASVEVTGPLAVRMHLRKPLATLLSDLEIGVISAEAARRGEILGAGAYRVVALDPDRRVLLERNPYYAGTPPPVPRIEVRTVADGNARAIMLVGGSADLTQNSVRADLVDAIAGRPRVRVQSGPGVVLTFLMMQNEDPALSDVRVRRAIAYAIDREHIIRVKFGGRAVIATGLLPASHWAYEGNVDRYAYDPARARALLDEAGFRDPDGPGGEPRLRLGYKTSADQFRLALARIIAAELGEVGIAVEVRAFEFGTFFEDIKKGSFQLASLQTAPITEPDFLYTYFHSERIPRPDAPSLHNRFRYRNERVDELVSAGRATFDRAARVALYSEAQKILARDLPVFPLWHEDNVVISNVDVDDYVILPSGSLGSLRATRKQARGL